MKNIDCIHFSSVAADDVSCSVFLRAVCYIPWTYTACAK